MRRIAQSIVLLALCLARSAAAHERTVSYSTWEIDGGRARVRVRLTPLDVSRWPWAAGADADRQIGAYLADHLALRAGEALCPVTDGPTRLATTPDRVVFAWTLDCPSSDDLAITSAVFLETAPSHLHLARVRLAGQPSRERVLSEAEPLWWLGSATEAPIGSSLADFLVLGIEHILTGYDHLVFLLGLLLLGGSLGDVVRIVTGFTVAHSITLGLAVLGVLRPEPAPIEALIGLSIALVAAENLWLAGGRRPGVRWAISAALIGLAAAAAWRRGAVSVETLLGLALFTACYLALVAQLAHPVRVRAAIAFVFGLIHGFGFAGVLLEAELPRERLASALFGFNAGVELGQLAAVLALWTLLNLTARYRHGVLRRGIVEYGSAVILAIGVYWYVSRAYG